ncbi:MAG: CoA transferase, partial [Parvibaculaceae bacterium]|nr:CoA transferase [Parvibaculaceae bacterium]
LTRVLAGPYCTMILADLGARVIKVEVPEIGDDSRQIGPFIKDQSAYFMGLNRGKESIALNLKQPKDRAILEALFEKADVIVENYRPGTMEKLGYGWDTLHARYPQLIYAAASGFGHSGPYMKKPAYDMVVQAMGGIMSVTGQPDSPPTRVGSSVGDITAGMFTAVGVNAALYDRATTGEARKVDVAMLDSQVAILENAIARYTATGDIPGPIGSRHPSIAPFQVYESSDGYVVIAAGNDALFHHLCDTLELPDLKTDPHFLTNNDRVENVAELTQLLEVRLVTQTTTHWIALLEEAGIPTGPINNVAQALSDPQILARKMVVQSNHPIAGTVRMAGNPIKISGFEDPTTRKAAPLLDQDREEILQLAEASLSKKPN